MNSIKIVGVVTLIATLVFVASAFLMIYWASPWMIIPVVVSDLTACAGVVRAGRLTQINNERVKAARG